MSTHYSFRPMTEPDARAIHAWRYTDEYTVYNAREGNDDISQYLDPRSPYYAVYDEDCDALVGFFAFGTAAEVSGDAQPTLYSGADRTLSVGLGLRPDLTGQGKGIGLAFVLAGLDFARQQFQQGAFRLFVFTFNKRAIRVYERAGFQPVGTVTGTYGEFLEMRRNA